MSILTGPAIIEAYARAQRHKADEFGRCAGFPRIDVDPWRPEFAGPNSLDVTLGDTLLRYDLDGDDCIDPASPPATFEIKPNTPSGGWLLFPGVLYLGATGERIACHGVVPWIDGRSSIGRLGVSVHVTAGRGDDGADMNFTLEITCVHPVILRPGMRIAQVSFMRTEGERQPYVGRYQHSCGPVASRFHLSDIRTPDDPGAGS